MEAVGAGPGARVDVLAGIQGSGQLPGVLPDPGRFRAVAELAEELGYDSIWAGEHLSFVNAILDLGVALAAFAAVTERIALGAGVMLLPLRHPSLAAKQAASLDYLVSPHRFAAGVEAVRAHAVAARRDPEALRHGVVAFARVEDAGSRARDGAREHLSRRYGMRFEPHHVERLCVAGTPEECAARVGEYAAAGAAFVSFNPAVDEDGFLEQVERLRTVASAGVAA